MDTELEAKFPNIDKNKIRKVLKKAGAKLIKKEFLQRRVVFNLPKNHEIKGGWLRVRDEGDKVTMSLKVVDGDKIENQKEIYLEISSFIQAALLLESIGCQKKAYQETKRELWNLDGVDITIDEWPFLEPFIEIEGKSEEEVKKVSETLGFNFSKALFGAVDKLYNLKYGVSEDVINNHTPEIVFNGANPFLGK
ncbi:class IV adenylate cyclase [Candidatus Daviesbacteria bacterium]|nr:class IV adenylate cyclase [Candidatus Daviesbacteria bacterium]